MISLERPYGLVAEVGKILFDRYAVRIAVDGRGGAEDDILYLVTLHRLEQVDAAGDVVFIVVQRDLRRLPTALRSGGEVDHGLYVVFGEDSVRASLSRMSAWWKRRSLPVISLTRSNESAELLQRLSITTTSWPCCSSSTQVWLPM